MFVVLYSRKDSEWKVADFGLTSEGGSGTFQASHLGRGTTSYRAPELLTNEEYNNKIDIWAIGCILNELATFKKTFGTDIEVYQFSKEQMPLKVTLDAFDEDTATCIRDVILRILQIEPKRRPSATELLKEFTRLAERHSNVDLPTVKIHQEFQRMDLRSPPSIPMASTSQGISHLVITLMGSVYVL